MPRGNLRFEPGDVAVSHGMLIISAYRDPPRPVGPTGGVSSSPGLVQTYGKYFVRFRIDAGVGVSYALLLWPADNSWPPEDRLQRGRWRPARRGFATLHYGDDKTQIQRRRRLNVTRWHTLGVQWLPGSLVFTLDGRRWAAWPAHTWRRSRWS